MVPNTIQHIWLRRLTYQNKSNGSRVITSEKDIISSKLGPYSYGTQNFHFFSRSFIDGSECAKNIINFSMFCILYYLHDVTFLIVPQLFSLFLCHLISPLFYFPWQSVYTLSVVSFQSFLFIIVFHSRRFFSRSRTALIYIPLFNYYKYNN